MIEFSITHSDEGLKSLYRDWWKHEHGVRNAWSTGVFFLCILVMFQMRSTAWYLVLPAVGSTCFLALVQSIRYQATKSALTAFAASGRPVLSYQLEEATLLEASAMGNVELPWRSFAGLVKIGGFWVLHRGPLLNAQFIAFPENQLPTHALAFLRERLADAAAESAQGPSSP